MRESERGLSMSLVAAEVSPLTIHPRAKLEPTHVGLLRFMVPMRGKTTWGLPMNRSGGSAKCKKQSEKCKTRGERQPLLHFAFCILNSS